MIEALEEKVRAVVTQVTMGGLMVVERLKTGVSYNPLSQAHFRDPYPGYDELRARDPIHKSMLGTYMLTRYDDCVAVLKDHKRFSSEWRNSRNGAKQHAKMRARGEDMSAIDEPPMLFTDPPRHSRLRRLVSKAFTPRAIAQLRPRLEAVIDVMLSPITPGAGSFDLVETVAHPLPMVMIAELLGVPATDRERFKLWSEAMAATIGVTSRAQQQRADKASAEFRDYLDGIMDLRRQDPQDDLISSLMAAEEEGDRLTISELHAIVELLLVAGNETTTNLIGNGIVALLRNPDQLALLRQQPDLIESAVEECLRYDSPVQYTERFALEELVLGGETLGVRQSVIVAIGGANRDPARFEQPNRLDITRQDNAHLSLSSGVHYCLGAGLARLEAQVAIGALVQRFPDMRLPEGPLDWGENTVLRGLRSLPLRC